MGIYFKKKRHIKVNENQIVNNALNDNNNNNNILIEIKEKPEEKPLCMKIYLYGNGKGKDVLINSGFNNNISDPYLKTKADKEFKTDQFHWILSVYSSDFQKEEAIQKIIEDVEKERNQVIDENNKKLLKNTVIIWFDDYKILNDYFDKLKNPKIILVSPSKTEIKIGKRYITNIITENMKENEVCSQIISSLWEIDCYFNERDNKICRYTPENIFKELEKDNSLFSINILLTGLSRVGKSTFINLLSGKMIAFESDENNSVTKKITEYYIYNKDNKEDNKEDNKKDSKKDNKKEHGAIKIIDTPGIIPYSKGQPDIRKDYLYEERRVMNMIKNNSNEQNVSKKIHFILFIFFKQMDLNLEGDNIKELFQNLKACNCPVYFLINGVEKDSDIEDYIYNINDVLASYDCDNLLNEDNVIKANFKKDDIEEIEIHGINKVFEKILNHINEKNKIIENQGLKEKMDSLIKDFRIIEKKEIFLSLEENDKVQLENLKSKINFQKRIEEIKNIWESNEFFSKINIQSILENGRENVKNCKNVIISLSNLNGILPSVDKDTPLISILQAFMVKEIEIGYGLNINSLNIGIKLLKNNFDEIINNKNVNNLDNLKDNNILDQNKLYQNIDGISKKINDLLDKSNKKLINQLSKFLSYLADNAKNNQLEDINNNFNIEFTNIIEEYCVMFFEKEIIESEKLTFMWNYLSKLNGITKDIEEYSKKDVWDNFEMEIKK